MIKLMPLMPLPGSSSVVHDIVGRIDQRTASSSFPNPERFILVPFFLLTVRQRSTAIPGTARTICDYDSPKHTSQLNELPIFDSLCPRYLHIHKYFPTRISIALEVDTSAKTRFQNGLVILKMDPQGGVLRHVFPEHKESTRKEHKSRNRTHPHSQIRRIFHEA